MDKFNKYFLLKENEVLQYVQSRLNFFDNTDNIISKEIGDGNLNYVFRVYDKNTGKSIIVKQAGEELRISKDMKISPDRGKIEAKILKLQYDLAPGFVPKVYYYDEIMKIIIMEDMIGHEMMRPYLMNFNIYENFGKDMSYFLANTLLKTSDLALGHKEKKALVKEFINPELCEISEDLVYTEPYLDNKNRNNVFYINKDFVENELYNDKNLHLEVAKLKYDFMSNAQALIHGDLHTGSIFINDEHIFVFDPEFAFYGPIGYDIGNIIANLLFSWCYANATLDNRQEKFIKFENWVFRSIEDIIDGFILHYNEMYSQICKDKMAMVEGFKQYYLDNILSDTAGVCGLEAIRRIVGMANVIDIKSIVDDELRGLQERRIIKFAKDCIINRNSYKTGKDYIDTFKRILEIVN